FEIDDSLHLLKFWSEFVGDPIQFVRIVSENLDFDRLRRAFQISQNVFQDLNKLNVNTGNALRNLCAQIGDYLLDIAFALGSRFQLDENIAFVLLRGEQA